MSDDEKLSEIRNTLNNGGWDFSPNDVDEIAQCAEWLYVKVETLQKEVTARDQQWNASQNILADYTTVKAHYESKIAVLNMQLDAAKSIAANRPAEFKLKPIHPRELKVGQQCFIQAERIDARDQWIHIRAINDQKSGQVLDFADDSGYSKNCNPIVWIPEEGEL